MALLVLLIHFFISNYADYLGKQKVYHSGEFIKHFMQGLEALNLPKYLVSKSILIEILVKICFNIQI